MTADPKPRKRVVNPNAGVAKVRRERRCRVCRRQPFGSHIDTLTRAHVVPRGQGGDDVDENLVPLCTGCHERLDGRDRETAVRFRGRLRDDEVAYAVERKGREWLDRRYPIGDVG